MRFVTAQPWSQRLLCLTIFVLIAGNPFWLSLQALAEQPPTEQASSNSAEAIEFFENRIRPVLAEHCYSCHSAEADENGELQAGLFVDSADGLRSGGDSGAAIMPGDAASSLLLAAMRYDTYEMPPQGKLDDSILRDFERWIESGAVDPRTESIKTLKAKPINFSTASDHWAYQPLASLPIPNVSPPVPNVAPPDSAWAATPIDSFIDFQAANSGLSPGPLADRRTLVRRLYFDLLGLPPTPSQITQFMQDDRPDAIERLVDRLMASPRFGERWGRHWLDLARYAESVTLRGLVQHQAWRYRDYVIQSFNCDLPYDVFLNQQVAGDLLSANTISQSRDQHVATTFLTLGNNNLEDQDKEKLRMDAVDEQLNVIGSAILAQTIGCARCHDHKFDPIPTSDYYALAGILRNSKTLQDDNVSNWIERPLPGDPAKEASLAEYKSTVESLKRKITEAEQELGLNKQNTDKSVAIKSLAGLVIDNNDATLTGAWEESTHTPRFVGTNYLHDQGTDRGKKLASFSFKVPESGSYEVRLSYSSGGNRSTRVPVSIQDIVDIHHVSINQRQPPTTDGLYTSLGEYQFDATMPGTVIVSNAEADGHVIVDSIQVLAKGSVSSTKLVTADAKTEAGSEHQQKLRMDLLQWQAELKELLANAPEQPKYMAIIEDPGKGDIPIHIRGNVHQHGKTVSRGVLTVAAGKYDLEIHDGQSGRLQLGQWLAEPSNPLPARVFANRVWLWLMGEGLVRTPDNFGTTGQSPTHPELLDFLAIHLIENDWSTKSLVRSIVLSQTYQRSSQPTEELLSADPENKFWLRQNRKRIDAESLVDSMLKTSENLDFQAGGKTIPDKLSADYGYEIQSNRRAVYWPILRNSIPDIFQVFDGANPSLVTGKRNSSTVAPQALLLLNSPWVIAQSRAAGTVFAANETASETIGLDSQITHAFETILGREPAPDEILAVRNFLISDQQASRAKRWGQVVQSLWSTIDFRYLH